MIKWDRNINGASLPNIGTSFEDALKYRNNKELAYQEGFEEFLQTAVPKVINGTEYYLHPNINLYIDLTPVCNCDCRFCIAKTNYIRNKIRDSDYLDKLENAIIELKEVNPSVQVVGGEPTIDNKICKVIDTIDKYQMKRPVLGTNGFGLDGKLVQRINRSSFEYVNISRHHYNEQTNQEIMHSYRLYANDELSQTAHSLEKKTRIQCNLIGGYIDTYGEAMQFIAYAYHNLGIANMAFAQLTPLPENDIYRQCIIDYVSERQIDIGAILNTIGNDTRFAFKKYRGGVACYYEIWEYMAYEKPVTVLFKYSDNKWLVEADRLPMYLPDLIFHTDGTLCGSWNKNIKRLI